MSRSSRRIAISRKRRRPRVAVIGAGAAGLVAARELIRAGACVCVFERARELGGLWNYQAGVDSDLSGRDPLRRRVHASLRTNLPRRLMAFRDLPFDDPDPLGPVSEFPSHASVRHYLGRFAQHFRLERWIRFGAEVQSVRRCRGGWLWAAARRPSEWFDAVAVCNGHYAEPWLPEIPGLGEFSGTCWHSHNYRRPTPFVGKRVVLVGAQSSGIDLAHELLAHAQSVQLCASHPSNVAVDSRVRVLPRLSALGPEASAVVEGGRCIRDVDAVIFCTGTADVRWALSPVESGSRAKARPIATPGVAVTARREQRKHPLGF